MERFAIDDLVAFKTSPRGKQYLVVGFTTNKIILSFNNEGRIEVDPIELLTAEETKNANEPLMPIIG